MFFSFRGINSNGPEDVTDHNIKIIRSAIVEFSALLVIAPFLCASFSGNDGKPECEGEIHPGNIRQMIFGGENAGACFSPDGKSAAADKGIGRSEKPDTYPKPKDRSIRSRSTSPSLNSSASTNDRRGSSN